MKNDVNTMMIDKMGIPIPMRYLINLDECKLDLFLNSRPRSKAYNTKTNAPIDRIM